MTIKFSQPIKRKIVMFIKMNQSILAELELDESSLTNGGFSFVFAPNEPKLVQISDNGQAPPVWLMWKPRSFNLLLGQLNELHVSSLELHLLEPPYYSSVSTTSVDGNDHDNGTAGMRVEPLNSTTNSSNNTEIEPESAVTTTSMDYDDEQEMTVISEQETQSRAEVSQTISSIRYNLTRAPRDSTEPVPIRLHRSGSGGSSLVSSIMKPLITGSPTYFTLIRNQWHKFEGRLDSPAAVSSGARASGNLVLSKA